MASNILPKIELKNSPKSEVGLFLKFLHHDFHKQQRNIILNSFPELKNDLNNIGEEDIIKNFVLNFYDRNSDKITSIIENDTRSLSQKGEAILNTLSDLMDADWSKRSVFYAVPTILPFSPFEENTFYYSILGKIRNRPITKSVIFIAAHEISHFIFYDTLKKIQENNRSLVLSKESEYYLKEALAPAVLNEEPLKEILELKNYSGNPELHGLNLSVNGENIGFTEFINSYYHKHKIIDKENFSSILFALINILSTIDEELIAKKEIWNKYGMKMGENQEALDDYKTPILLILK